MNNAVTSQWRKASTFSLVLSLALLPFASVARADECPEADEAALAWLDKMSRSLNEVSYHGVVTLQRGEELQVIQVSHSVDGESSSERLTTLTGQGAKVERTEHPLHSVHPGHRLLQIGTEIQSGNCGLRRHYRLHVSEGDRVAGRKAVRILIEPRDMYRYGYVMDLDRETGLLLKTLTVGSGEKVVERFQFASLSLGNQVISATDVSVVHHAQHALPSIMAAEAPGWSPQWVPGGFVFTDTPVAPSGRRTYTDGLAVFSVFIEELGREIRPGEGVVRNGGTISYTRGMALAGKPVLVTVIGEVPINTARMVADSVNWVP